MANGNGEQTSFLNLVDSIIGKGISAYVDTQLAYAARPNDPTPYQQSPYGYSPQGQPVTAGQAALSNPATWAIVAGAALVVGIILFAVSKK